MNKKHAGLSFPAILAGLAIIFAFLVIYQRVGTGGADNGFRARLADSDINCLPQGHQRLALHFHPRLTILIEGEPVAVPANIGVTNRCMAELHTHDDSGTIHLESTGSARTFTLGQFFAVWGQPFSAEQILDRVADDKFEIVMTVDGEPSQAFGDLVLKDEQEIVISYQAKETALVAEPDGNQTSTLEN